MNTTEKTAWGPYLLVAAGAVVGLCAIALGAPPPAGATVMGCALVVGALVRLRAADARAGALAVRSRGMDALVLGGLGALLVLGSLLLLLPLHNT
ncbi:DUF3017 domain-containing protein [Microbispora sp. ATCC PTA-5024]|uniref:DUF3017 domain-containing protein n=1 Tax=Microbispora sp. ATCC PTA-5024 TaxID=316330 RepID=UPI0003DBC27B|nr:DUF3017 domain-containing protein [Microbispora sp. ATCC PTA-5024]ETK33257.1 hypothetical protein MPTA5024_25405 [Microbispora sp. ATCC PTA-5024]